MSKTKSAVGHLSLILAAISFASSAAAASPTINASVTTSGGSISPAGAVTVASGGIQLFTITMDAGYTVADVLVDGAPVGAVTNYLFTDVQADHSISVSLAPVVATATLTQTVIDTARLPVAGAQVMVVGSPSYQAVTDASGTFMLTVPLGVTFAYSISAAGFRTWYSQDTSLTHSIVLANRPIYADAEVSGWGVAPGYAAFRGQARDATILQNLNNPSVSAASVLYPGLEYQVSYTPTCGTGTGTCLFMAINVWPGDAVLLTASASGYVTKQILLNPLPPDAVGQAGVDLVPGPRDLSLTVSGSGSGTVAFSPGYNCSGTCRQEYPSGSLVTLTPLASADSYFAGWSGCDAVNGTVCTVSMTTSRSVMTNFMKISSGTGTIFGRITDSSGAGVAAATVFVRPEHQSTSYCLGCGYGFSQIDGSFVINNVIPGTYLGAFYNQRVLLGTTGVYLVTTNQWYDHKRSMAAADVLAVTDGSAIELDAVYPPFGQVSGTVTGANGAGLPNVTIRAYDIDDQGLTDVALTDASGNYSVQHLPSGTYRLRFVANNVLGPLPAQNLVGQVAYATVIAPDIVPGVNATMLPGRSISGRVTNTIGLPVLSAYAIVIDADGNTIVSAQTDSTGAYRALGIPPGNYRVLFKAVPPTSGTTIDVNQLYSRRFHGGRADFDGASLVTVPPDADLSSIDGVLEASGPAIVPSGPPVLTLVSYKRDYGVEVVGTSSLRSFALSNGGTADLLLGTLSRTGADFSILNDRCSGVTLAPTKVCTYQVAFAPLSEGVKTGTVAMSSNDPDIPVLTVPLTGIGSAPTGNSGTTAVQYGDNVSASPTTDVNLTFASVTSAEGTVTAAAISTLSAPVPSNFRLLNGTSFEITTTASYAGPITVCINYDPATMSNPANEPNLRMFHYSGGAWQDVTSSVDTVAKRVCGTTGSLSPFLLAEPTVTIRFDGFFSPIANQPAVNGVKAGQTVPVKWRITDSNGTPVADRASFNGLASYAIDCSSLAGDETTAIEEQAVGSSGLQYSGDGYWQFNWQTARTYAGQCRVLVLTLGDGTTRRADFKLK